MKPIYLQSWSVSEGVVVDAEGGLVQPDPAIVRAIPISHRALLTVEGGSIADGGRCPDCRAKVIETPEEVKTTETEVRTSPVVISTPPQDAQKGVIRPRTDTGHYRDVDCLIDEALTANGYTSRSKRDEARRKLISG